MEIDSFARVSACQPFTAGEGHGPIAHADNNTLRSRRRFNRRRVPGRRIVASGRAGCNQGKVYPRWKTRKDRIARAFIARPAGLLASESRARYGKERIPDPVPQEV
jgi:hypothetical protein